MQGRRAAAVLGALEQCIERRGAARHDRPAYAGDAAGDVDGGRGVTRGGLGRRAEGVGGGEAEAWLEEGGRAFVADGHRLRKLSTGWFAFHGTYAGSSAAASPIEAQLRAVRADAAGLAAFLERVSAIAEVGELEAMARAAGPLALPARLGEHAR